MDRRAAIRSLVAGTAGMAFPAFAQSGPIVLGQSAAFTGPAAQLGIQMNAGARIHFDAVNANGGVNGQPIELRVLDDGYEPERCKANTDAFIKAGVFALFGYVGTPTCVAVLPAVVDSWIPFFGPFTGAEALRDPLHRNVFHVRASYYDETAAIVKQLTTLGLKKIAVFRQNDAYGQAGLDGVLRALKPLNLEPVAIGLVERNTVNVNAALQAILPKQPDAVVQISAYKSCAAFIRAARKAGFGGTFYNVSFVGTQALADELGRDGLGVVVSQVMPFPFSAATAIGREYQAAVKRAGPEYKPNFSSIEGYISAKIFTEGLRRAGKNPSREALIVALESIREYDLGGFRVGFSPRNHVASRFVDLTMITENQRVRS